MWREGLVDFLQESQCKTLISTLDWLKCPILQSSQGLVLIATHFNSQTLDIHYGQNKSGTKGCSVRPTKGSNTPSAYEKKCETFTWRHWENHRVHGTHLRLCRCTRASSCANIEVGPATWRHPQVLGYYTAAYFHVLQQEFCYVVERHGHCYVIKDLSTDLDKNCRLGFTTCLYGLLNCMQHWFCSDLHNIVVMRNWDLLCAIVVGVHVLKLTLVQGCSSRCQN